MDWMLWVTVFTAKIAAAIVIGIGSLMITSSKWYVKLTMKMSAKYMDRWFKSDDNEES